MYTVASGLLYWLDFEFALLADVHLNIPSPYVQTGDRDNTGQILQESELEARLILSSHLLSSLPSFSSSFLPFAMGLHNRP